jgi:nitroreductase
MTQDSVLKCIINRNSCRNFLEQFVKKTDIETILNAGLHAPSGKNGQPWKFIVVQKDKVLLKKISALTVYDSFVKTADTLIVVFLDKTRSYHYIKDCQAIGACIQNMLLQATKLGIGTCWIGEILNRDIFVKKLLNIDNSLDLMAVVALGYPAEENKHINRNKKRLEDFFV